MFFVKSCHGQDNVHKRKTLRIGTLNEYRSTEQLQIVDKHEGTFTFDLNLKGIHIEREVFNFMNYNHNSFVHFYCHELASGGRSSVMLDGLYLRRYRASIKMMNANRFIFCMSQVDHYDDAKYIFPDYDDKWFFEQKKAIIIAKEIGHQLNKEIISKEKSGVRVFDGEYEIEKVHPVIKIQNINYKDRIINVDNQFFYNNWNEISSAMTGASFIKPNRYSHEKEVRFVFDYHFRDKLLSPAMNSIIVPMREEVLPLFK